MSVLTFSCLLLNVDVITVSFRNANSSFCCRIFWQNVSDEYFLFCLLLLLYFWYFGAKEDSQWSCQWSLGFLVEPRSIGKKMYQVPARGWCPFTQCNTRIIIRNTKQIMKVELKYVCIYMYVYNVYRRFKVAIFSDTIDIFSNTICLNLKKNDFKETSILSWSDNAMLFFNLIFRTSYRYYRHMLPYGKYLLSCSNLPLRPSLYQNILSLYVQR